MDFYFSYAGSKRKEIREFIDLIDLNNYENIIEPFGGSLAFSRYIYNLYPNKNFFVSDINDELIYFCNNFYKKKEYIIDNAIIKINEINNKIDYDNYINKNQQMDNDENFLTWYLLRRSYYNIRQGLYPSNNRKPKFIKYNDKTINVDNFFKKVEYKNQDYKIYMEKFKNDESALIFLDPPYINSCNEFYSNQNIKTKDINKQFDELWEYLYNYFNNCKCKFILIVNDNFFMRLSFSKWFKKSYHKKYEATKKETRHNIFSNIINNI
jgi:site-specific DNA-adenine methylase